LKGSGWEKTLLVDEGSLFGSRFMLSFCSVLKTLIVPTSNGLTRINW
jgi:hypothetical protein